MWRKASCKFTSIRSSAWKTLSLGRRVQGLGFRVQGLGFRVSGALGKGSGKGSCLRLTRGAGIITNSIPLWSLHHYANKNLQNPLLIIKALKIKAPVLRGFRVLGA